MKKRISIHIFAALVLLASCGKAEFPSSKNVSETVPVEFHFNVDTLNQTKGLFSGYGGDMMFNFATTFDTIYAKPYYKGNEQPQEHEMCALDSEYKFRGNWKEWKKGTKFIFFYPTSLGRDGYVSLKNQSRWGDGNTHHYALKGSCSTVRVGSVNEATLRPLGSVLRINLNENKKISINARTAEGRFVVGIDSTGAAILAPPEATAAECTLLETDLRRNHFIVIPAGIKLSFYDGETKLKTTRDSGFTPGTWATLSFGEDPIQVVTLPATDVSAYNATLQGKLITDHPEDISRIWFAFSTDKALIMRNFSYNFSTLETKPEPDGSFSYKLSLKSNTTYYYAAYYGSWTGDILSFTTPSFSPKYTFIDPKVSVNYSYATIGNNLKTDDPDVRSTRINHCLYSKTYSTKSEIIQKGLRGGQTITGLERGTTYYYVPVFTITSVMNENIQVYGDVYSFTTLSSDAGFNEAEVGEAVDLGLSVKWRSCNLGASTPLEFGITYCWGETSQPLYDEKYNKYNADGGSLTLSKEDDRAHYVLGGNWRMPTLAEIEEMKSKCTLTAITYYSSDGTPPHFIIRSNVPGHTHKYIILPAVGTTEEIRVWTSSLVPYAPYDMAYACAFSSYSTGFNIVSAIRNNSKYYIRPVCDTEN